jgi:regulatory protein
VLDRFTEVGLIDDAAFATAWVASRQRGRGLARRALAAELHRKGIDRETAGQALETIDPDDEVESARRLVRRRLPSLARQERVVAQRRLLGLLARKGYPPGLAVAVVRDELRSAEFPAQDAEDRADLRADLRAEEEAAEDAVETELRAP